MAIKQSYLSDKSAAVKNGHAVSNELDDFLMWCTANKIKIADLTNKEKFNKLHTEINNVSAEIDKTAENLNDWLATPPNVFKSYLHSLGFRLSNLDLLMRDIRPHIGV